MNSFIEANLSNFQWIANPGLVAHLMALTHFVHKNTMDELQNRGRFKKLSLAYEGYISILAERDYSPGELAAKLNISKQACSKTIRELETMGLIDRRKNPQDSRSSLLSLTDQGLQLMVEGLKVTEELQLQFAETVGQERLDALIEILEKLCDVLAIEIPTYKALESVSADTTPIRLNMFLLKLSNYCYQALISSLGEKGFEGLKPHFSQVLSVIIADAGRIQLIASVVGVSKQAIAATAMELEELGYITREPDPNDKRQVILNLSPRGQQLLAESAASVRELEESIRTSLAPDKFLVLRETLETLYIEGLERNYSEAALPIRIQKVAEDLLKEFGTAGARALAQQLMTITRGVI